MLGLSLNAQAVVVTVSGINEGFNIRQLNELSGGTYGVEVTGTSTGEQQFRFTIPDEYVITNRSGQIDLWRSLERWRASSPRGVGYPYTDSSSGQRIAYFPITSIANDANGIVQFTENQYLALPFLLERKNTHPNLSVQSRDGREVSLVVPRVGLVDAIAAAGRQGSVNCTSNSRRAAECLICNCANEAGSTSEGHTGKVAVNRTVLSRLTRQSYPDTICGVVWQPSQFSWTFGGRLRSRDVVTGDDLRACVRASIEAVNLGAWEWDMFYNPNSVTPAWAARFAHRGSYTHANHRFMNSGAPLKSDRDELLRRELNSGQGVSGVE